MSRSSNNINGKLIITNPVQLQDLVNFTYSFWIRLEGVITSDTTFVFDFGGLKTVFIDSDGRLNVTIYRATTNSTCLTSINTITYNEWQHIAVTYETSSGIISLYISDTSGNWRWEGTSIVGVGNLTSDVGNNIYLLNDSTGADNHFPGSIDEVGIWDRALTTSELQHLAIDRYAPQLISSGLVGAWNISGTNPEIDSVYGNNAIPDPSDLYVTDDVPLILTANPGSESNITVYAPNLTSPTGQEVYNKGVISIGWETKNPPTNQSNITLNDITYEIEYTENHIGRETVWHTIRRRISGQSTSYSWYVGRMLKSDTLRVRIRAFCELLNIYSEYSPSFSDFSVNIFKIISPAILSPLSGNSYADYITIILDEGQTVNTYNQKIRYKIEYQSTKADINWTVLFKDLPVGSTPIRWNIDSLSNSDDYKLKLTVYDPNSDQYTTNYVNDIKISHSGLFYIDTVPPKGIIEFENHNQITNSVDQIINTYVEDEVTDVKDMAFADINLTKTESTKTVLTLGPIQDENSRFDPVQLKDNCSSSLKIGYSPKLQWSFKDESGLMRLDGIFRDYGDNDSCQDRFHGFMQLWKTDEVLTDVFSDKENRDYLVISSTGTSSTESKRVNTAYISTESGKIYRLEPFPIKIYDLGYKITRLNKFVDTIYVFAYNSNTDVAKVYRDDKTDSLTLLTEFTDSLSEIKSVAEYDASLYLGMQNGQLWRFDGTSFSKVNTFDNPVNYLFGDSRYLYIGFFSGTKIYIYNGLAFFGLNVEV